MPIDNLYDRKIAERVAKINKAFQKRQRAARGGAQQMSGGLDLGSLIQLPMKLLSGFLGGAVPENELMLGRNKATYTPLGLGISGGRRRNGPPAKPRARKHRLGGAYSGGASSGGAYSGGAYSGGAYSGGEMFGGRRIPCSEKASAAQKLNAKKNPWIQFVAMYRRDNPEESYYEALQNASVLYREDKKAQAEQSSQGKARKPRAKKNKEYVE